MTKNTSNKRQINLPAAKSLEIDTEQARHPALLTIAQNTKDSQLPGFNTTAWFASQLFRHPKIVVQLATRRIHFLQSDHNNRSPEIATDSHCFCTQRPGTGPDTGRARSRS